MSFYHRSQVKDSLGRRPGRQKRFALQGSRWAVDRLSWRVSQYPADLSKAEVDRELQAALEVWAGVANLTFTRRLIGPVHIDIRFEAGRHGDGDPFDGPGGTLAHAFFPVYGELVCALRLSKNTKNT